MMIKEVWMLVVFMMYLMQTSAAQPGPDSVACIAVS